MVVNGLTALVSNQVARIPLAALYVSQLLFPAERNNESNDALITTFLRMLYMLTDNFQSGLMHLIKTRDAKRHIPNTMKLRIADTKSNVSRMICSLLPQHGWLFGTADIATCSADMSPVHCAAGDA